MDRRKFLEASSLAALYGLLPVADCPRYGLPAQATVPVRAITGGKGFHWFGYYDKLQFDLTGRYVLGMEVGFEGRTPTGDDVVKIGVIDLKKNDQWRTIGESRSWGWQQGCMLQWIPGSKHEVIWNDREGDHFVSRVYNIKTGKSRTLSKAVYALSPDGKWAIGTEFSRIQNLRPGYGYAGIADPYEEVKAPKEIGLYKMDLRSGETSLLFSLADLAAIPHNGESVVDNFHWFNHLLVNTDGSRFTFLHRWRPFRTDRQTMAKGGFVTRMFTASADGSDLYCVDPSGFTSHFIWRDPQHICAFTKPAGGESGFYVIKDKTLGYERIGKEKMPVNGHQTYLPVGNKQDWLLNDTYAQGKNRLQTPYLYHIPTDKRIELGQFKSPVEYAGEWRCDLHPRYSPDGTKVIIDSTHEDKGRQMYLLDISGLT
ncbi:hypothetical protein [Dyadobacter helix]|nr:hypothetical protein [Dyadobacter sp. CECT 9275]